MTLILGTDSSAALDSASFYAATVAYQIASDPRAYRIDSCSRLYSVVEESRVETIGVGEAG